MRVLMLGLLSAVLAACSSGPPSSVAAKGKAAITSRDGLISVADGAFHCIGNGPNPMKYPKCQDGIPVIVLLKDDGSCLSLVPYYELVVHAGQSGDTDISWRLYGPESYEFDADNGIDLQAKSGGLIPPGTNYRDKLRVSRDRFRVRLIANASPLTFQHEAKVKGPAGACTPIDPLISNK